MINSEGLLSEVKLVLVADNRSYHRGFHQALWVSDVVRMSILEVVVADPFCEVHTQGC